MNSDEITPVFLKEVLVGWGGESDTPGMDWEGGGGGGEGSTDIFLPSPMCIH